MVSLRLNPTLSLSFIHPGARVDLLAAVQQHFRHALDNPCLSRFRLQAPPCASSGESCAAAAARRPRSFRETSAPVGRPPLEPEVRALIRKMSGANPLWGAPRIHGELTKLGIEVSQAVVSKYMIRRPSRLRRTGGLFSTIICSIWSRPTSSPYRALLSGYCLSL